MDDAPHLKESYDKVIKQMQLRESKTLDVTNVEEAKQKVVDVKVVGNGDLFRLVSKASSENQGWMKSTKAAEVEGGGLIVQVTTQQKNPDGSYTVAEALTYVPFGRLVQDENGNLMFSIVPRN